MAILGVEAQICSEEMLESILVTGAAGFIGFHLAQRLLAKGYAVTGVDNVNDYYDVRLKKARLDNLSQSANFRFVRCDIADRDALAKVFKDKEMAYVVHLAGQAGVAYSAENPASYVDSNLVGFANILEGCRHARCRHLIYASSSSVYGNSEQMPLRIVDRADEPLSLYAATKRANELMAYAYAHAFSLPATGLRFFTVYGPWGRPDMAVWLFTKAIFDGSPVHLFNSGNMRRDFTYIHDVIEALVRLIEKPPAETCSSGERSTRELPPHRVLNVGNEHPVVISRLVDILERLIGRRAERIMLPMRPVDVMETYADSSDLDCVVGFRPNTPIEDGLRHFVEWFQSYNRVHA